MRTYNILKPWYQKWWGVILIIIIVLLLAFIFSFSFAVYQRVQDIRQQPNVDSLQMLELIPDYSPYLGPVDAPMEIVEFADWQCSYCAQGSSTVVQLLNQYAGLIKLVYRQFPIAETHPQAWSAAIASTCVQGQGKFWEYHDLLFANQADLSIENLFALAQGLGLDMDQWQQCYEDEKYAWQIRKDLTDGADLGIAGTPTYFVNGQMLSGAVSLDYWQELVESVLLNLDKN